ncbi:hypothetical protein [Imhoffiella purpurea]|uniref:Uncharacterized protein n=1 Tax=Imhoffiella purpurea TaxID=1249627 RepID=W9V7E4_9GAMM|nr:hypothetical protein [Imhoffiella purpurea]EXJ15493.1 hypothetical protein D779_1235 [Imhoffiella purpurea]
MMRRSLIRRLLMGCGEPLRAINSGGAARSFDRPLVERPRTRTASDQESTGVCRGREWWR